MKTLTREELILHEEINLKGSDFLFPLGHKNREVRLDRKSAYSLMGVKSLHKILNKLITEGK